MQNDLIQISRGVKREGDALLRATRLLDFLSHYGEVMIRGSYELDLMIARDLDIYVIGENDKDVVLEALRLLILENKFRGFFFYDFVARRKKGFPRGYYIGLKTRFRGQKWKIDIWFMKSMDNVSDRFMRKIKNQLNPESRLQILKLKNLVKTKGVDIPSYLIYQAVIEGGVKSLSSLKKYTEFI